MASSDACSAGPSSSGRAADRLREIDQRTDEVVLRLGLGSTPPAQSSDTRPIESARRPQRGRDISSES